MQVPPRGDLKENSLEMRIKKTWLAEAKFGTHIQKKQLINNLRITPNWDGTKADPVLAFNNSVRGFYAEEITKLYLENRKAFTGRDYKWEDDGIVYEKWDTEGPHKSEPDGKVILKDESEATFDVKSNKWSRAVTDEEGVRHRVFNRTHNAQFIFWYNEDEHSIHVCKRISPLYDKQHVWDNADYEDLGAEPVEDLESVVNSLLKTLV